MDKLFIEDLEISGKKVLMRADFNVPLDEEGAIVDAAKIEATLPSIRYVLDKGGSLILMSHLGRPKHAYNPALSLAPIAKFLSHILTVPVKMAPDCVGSHVEDLANKLKPKEVLLLENLRFHRAEEFPGEDEDFAKELATYGDCYVNDAFGCSHRQHSSIYFLPKLFPNQAAAGYLLKKEVDILGSLLKNPKRPFYGILGGAKVSTKIGVIRALLKKVDLLLIGGAMAYTFLKSQGISVGDSLVEDHFLEEARALLEENKNKLLLPMDFKGAQECSFGAPTKIFKSNDGIPKGYQGLDIGPDTIYLFKQKLQNAQTVLWNGPVGVFEIEPFNQGTMEIATFIANKNIFSIVAGGDSIAAVRQMGLEHQMTHLSTGGGASLEFIEFGTLPGIEALSSPIFNKSIK